MSDKMRPFNGDENNYSPLRMEDWLAIVASPDRRRPRTLDRAAMKLLGRRDLLVYNDQRAVWHANLGPIQTPQLLRLHEGLAEVVESNREDGDKVKPSVFVDAFPGLGKTTAVLDFAKKYHREQIKLRGRRTAAGHHRVPVVNITLTGNITIRGLNEAICRFYGLPETGNADQLAERACLSARAVGTTLVVVDFTDRRKCRP